MLNEIDKFEIFDDLVEDFCPDNGHVVLLKAYFDASERPDGVFSVAGYALEKHRVNKFQREWDSVFGKYGGFHMTDLANKQNGFKGISNDEAGRLITEGVALANKRAAYGVAVSCDLNELNPLLPKGVQGFQSAYPVCARYACTTLSQLAKNSGGLSYVFEAGDLHQSVVNKFMDDAYKDEYAKNSFQLKAWSFLGKEEAIALQSADMLAWEWAKWVSETHLTDKRPLRKSLEALLLDEGRPTKKIRYYHMEGERLAQSIKTLEKAHRAND